jgi:hypothetical protein
MSSAAPIIVAAISAAISVLATGIASWSTHTLNKRKSIQEAETLLYKYRDPLLLAARDLQSRLYNILFQGVLYFGNGPPRAHDALYVYTMFLVGQYFACIHIQRHQGQFTALIGGDEQLNRTKAVIEITNKITELLNTIAINSTNRDKAPGAKTPWASILGLRSWRQRDKQWDEERQGRQQSDAKQSDLKRRNARHRIPELGRLKPQSAERPNLERLNTAGLRARHCAFEQPFVLWKDHQRAMGEVMTKRDEKGDLTCMDFIEFSRLWKSRDPSLQWFHGIHEAIHYLVPSSAGPNNNNNASKVQDPPATSGTPWVQQTHGDCETCKAYLKIRLLLLQHLLVDLIEVLDGKGLVRAGGALITKGNWKEILEPYQNGAMNMSTCEYRKLWPKWASDFIENPHED